MTKEEISGYIESYLEDLSSEREFDNAFKWFSEGFEVVVDGVIEAYVMGDLSYYVVKDTGGSYGDGFHKVYEDRSYVSYTLSDIIVEVYDDEGELKERYPLDDIKN